MNTKKILIALLVSLLVSACLFERTIDSSNEKTMKKSVQKIMQNMSSSEQTQFQKSLQTIMFADIKNFGDLVRQDKAALEGAFYARVDGKTASQINKMAENIKLTKK